RRPEDRREAAVLPDSVGQQTGVDGRSRESDDRKPARLPVLRGLPETGPGKSAGDAGEGEEAERGIGAFVGAKGQTSVCEAEQRPRKEKRGGAGEAFRHGSETRRAAAVLCDPSQEPPGVDGDAGEAGTPREDRVSVL